MNKLDQIRKTLIETSDQLDELGLNKLANQVDRVILKLGEETTEEQSQPIQTEQEVDLIRDTHELLTPAKMLQDQFFRMLMDKQGAGDENSALFYKSFDSFYNKVIKRMPEIEYLNDDVKREYRTKVTQIKQALDQLRAPGTGVDVEQLKQAVSEMFDSLIYMAIDTIAPQQEAVLGRELNLQ